MGNGEEPFFKPFFESFLMCRLHPRGVIPFPLLAGFGQQSRAFVFREFLQPGYGLADPGGSASIFNSSSSRTARNFSQSHNAVPSVLCGDFGNPRTSTG